MVLRINLEDDFAAFRWADNSKGDRKPPWRAIGKDPRQTRLNTRVRKVMHSPSAFRPRPGVIKHAQCLE